MSVAKSERRLSDIEYIVTLAKIEIFFIGENNNEKKRVPTLSDELVKLAVEAYNNATMYYELCRGTMIGPLQGKKKYCKKTFYSARQLASQINILIQYRMNCGKPTKGLQIKTQELKDVTDQLHNQLRELNKEKEGNKNL